MRKWVVLAFVFCFVSLTTYAQGFYFDVGLGLGKGWTKVDGYDMVDGLKSAGVSVSELAFELGLKAGYGPFGNIPLYVVGEFGGFGHRIYDSTGYLQFNSYIIGPGVIFYPVSLIQLGLSMGYSFTSNQTDIPGLSIDNSKGGFAWNISAALDFGKKNNGCLLGVKYFNANNKLKTSNVDEKASMFGIFIKYAYRNKVPSSLE